MAEPTFKPEDERQFLSIREVTAILGISRPTAYKAIRDGSLPHVRVAGRLLVPKAVIEEWKKAA